MFGATAREIAYIYCGVPQVMHNIYIQKLKLNVCVCVWLQDTKIFNRNTGEMIVEMRKVNMNEAQP